MSESAKKNIMQKKKKKKKKKIQIIFDIENQIFTLFDDSSQLHKIPQFPLIA